MSSELCLFSLGPSNSRVNQSQKQNKTKQKRDACKSFIRNLNVSIYAYDFQEAAVWCLGRGATVHTVHLLQVLLFLV